jgi:stress-induced morphogen
LWPSHNILTLYRFECTTLSDLEYLNSQSQKQQQEMEKMTPANQLIKPYFKCQICQKNFTNFLDVEKHNQSEHNGIVSTSVAATTISKKSPCILPKMPKLVPMPQNSGNQNGSQGYHQFVSDSALEMKKARDQKQQKENQQNHEIVVLDEPQQKTTNDGKHFVCKICAKKFEKRCNLKNHLATAHSLKGGLVFAKQNSNRVLEQNMTKIQALSNFQPNEKQQQKQQNMLPDKENQHFSQKLDYFECPMCGQCFTTFSDIESHMKLKHQKQQHKLQQNQKPGVNIMFRI